MHQPIGNCKGVVVLLHGYFSSTKLGPANLYVSVARLFAQLGFEFWRFDSFGVGDSDGDFSESTYELRLSDYEVISEEALKGHQSLSYLGHSIGTSIGVRLANKFDKSVSNLYLLSPSFGPITGIDTLFDPTQLRELEDVGCTLRKGLVITSDFLGHVTDEGIYSEIRQVGATAFSFYGLMDEFYDRLSILKATEKMSKYTLFEIEGADHNFLQNRGHLMQLLKNVLASETVA